MSHISGMHNSTINPLVGDFVQVYQRTGFKVWMKVTERRWTMTNDSTLVLSCYLAPLDGFTIPQLEEILRNQGFRW